MVICLERGADLHMVQLMPLPLNVSCFSNIQTGFTFLVPAHPGSPGQKAIKRVCVSVFIVTKLMFSSSKQLFNNDELQLYIIASRNFSISFSYLNKITMLKCCNITR